MLIACGILAAALWPLQGVGALMLLPVSAGGAVLFLVAGHLLGLKESREVAGRFLKRRPRGLPPTVDPGTQEVLAALHDTPQAGVQLVDGAALVVTADFTARIVAQGGVLSATRTDGGGGEDLTPRPVQAVMRVGGGPPRLAGLVLGDTAIRADGDQVVEGMATGPVIPVSG